MYEVSGGEPLSNKKNCKEIMDYIMGEVYRVQNTSEAITGVEDIIKNSSYKSSHLRYFWARLIRNGLLMNEGILRGF
jgi:hypothetical protein